MRTKTTTAITAVKHEMHLREWTAQIEAQQASGMTVQIGRNSAAKFKEIYMNAKRNGSIITNI